MPFSHSVLYLHVTILEASPKAISRRTSYLRVRLEFHRYPQVIRWLFNAKRFGPPRNFTSASSCPWVGHPVSGLRYATIAQLRLGFPSATDLKSLTLLHNVTRWPVLQKVRGRTLKVLPLLVDIGFQVLFHSPSGVLFTFPSRYYTLSVTRKYLALRGGPPSFPQSFTCSVVLWSTAEGFFCFVYRTFTFCGGSFQILRLQYFLLNDCVHNPCKGNPYRFGLIPFRSPLLRESSFLSFPSGT